MSERTTTSLSVSAKAIGREHFMGDGTVMYITFYIHSREHGYSGGVIGSQSLHLTAEDAKKIIAELSSALLELGELKNA